MADKKQNFRIVDDPNVHEIYANSFLSAGFDGRSVTITVGAARTMPEFAGEGTHEEAQARVFVLEMSTNAAIDFVSSVEGMLMNMGLIRKEPPKPAGGAPFSGDTWGR